MCGFVKNVDWVGWGWIGLALDSVWLVWFGLELVEFEVSGLDLDSR